MEAMRHKEAAWLRLREAAPAAAADLVLGRVRLTDEQAGRVGVNVEEIVKGLGISVHRKGIDRQNLIGAASGNGDGTAQIWLNPQFGTEWQRWALAHELGHLLMHPLGHVWLFATYDVEPADRHDEQAESFARELMMPRGVFRAYLGAAMAKMPGSAATSVLAELFGVPEHAVVARMRDKNQNRHGRWA